MKDSINQLAVVTGASKGVGRGVAKRLASEGVTVVLVARRIEALEAVEREIKLAGGRAFAISTDLTKRKSVENMSAQVHEMFGAPDILVNSAGTWYIQDFSDRDYESWEEMINLNIKGYMYTIGEFLSGMKAKGKGHIVNISSEAGVNPLKGMTVYSGTKFFWRGATQALREELQGSGVRLTNIHPGIINTEGLHTTFNREKDQQAMLKFGMGSADNVLNSQDTMLRPEDIGECVWDVVSKGKNCYLLDIHLRDSVFQ